MFMWLLDARSKMLLKTPRYARVIEQIIATCTKQPQNIHNYKLSFEKINTCVTAKYVNFFLTCITNFDRTKIH